MLVKRKVRVAWREDRGFPWGVLLVLVGLLALLSTGCQARLAIDLVVDAEGAGTLAVAVAADAALRDEAVRRGGDPLDGVADAGRRLAASGWTVEDTTGTDGSRAVRLSTAFAGPEQFNALAADLAAALAAPEVVPLEHLRLELTEDLVRVEGTAGLVPTAATRDIGLEPDEAVALLAAGESFVYEISVLLPGEVLETTAEDAAVAGEAGEGASPQPLRWRVMPGEEVRVLAVGERPRDAWWLLAVAGAAGGVLALLGLVVLTRRRRRRRRLRALRARGAVSWR